MTVVSTVALDAFGGEAGARLLNLAMTFSPGIDCCVYGVGGLDGEGDGGGAGGVAGGAVAG